MRRSTDCCARTVLDMSKRLTELSEALGRMEEVARLCRRLQAEAGLTGRTTALPNGATEGARDADESSPRLPRPDSANHAS